MPIRVGEYRFEGPFKFVKMVRNAPGLYAVHYYRDGQFFLLDIGEEVALHDALSAHPNQSEWDRFGRGVLTFSVLYTGTHSDEERQAVVRELRAAYEPACGPR